jgi:hypothetical protein
MNKTIEQDVDRLTHVQHARGERSEQNDKPAQKENSSQKWKIAHLRMSFSQYAQKEQEIRSSNILK